MNLVDPHHAFGGGVEIVCCLADEAPVTFERLQIEQVQSSAPIGWGEPNPELPAKAISCGHETVLGRSCKFAICSFQFSICYRQFAIANPRLPFSIEPKKIPDYTIGIMPKRGADRTDRQSSPGLPNLTAPGRFAAVFVTVFFIFQLLLPLLDEVYLWPYFSFSLY